MTIASLSAAKKVCSLTDWGRSNLEIQKILYIAHMVHLGRHGTPLVDETFEAWDYGPVLPSVYHKAKAFGSGPVKNVFHSVPDVGPGTEAEVIAEAVELLKGKSPGQLVAITHWDEGAWSKAYVPGARGLPIPNSEIRDEYTKRTQ